MADTPPETRHDAITIRGVRADDAPAIAEIYRPIVETTVISFELVPPDAGEIARRIEATLEAGYPYLVAERDGTVTGYAYAARFRGRAAYDGTAETSIYVRRDVKRGGVGRALQVRGQAPARGGGGRYCRKLERRGRERRDCPVARQTVRRRGAAAAHESPGALQTVRPHGVR